MRQIAHHLDPVVAVGHSGVTDAVLAEVERALKDHELIKVRIHDADRVTRKASCDSMATTTGAELVQTIGKVIVLYRRNADADPELSNVARASGRR